MIARSDHRPLLAHFRDAFVGVRYGLSTQRNLRIQACCGLAVVLAGLFFNLATWEWAALVISIGIVLAAELLNTAIECTTDLVTVESHPLAKAAKDTAAGAVLLTAATAAIVGLIVFVPHVL